jgi:hypothetical protein
MSSQVIVRPSNLIVLTRDNAASNGFYPPADDAVTSQALEFFSSDRISLGNGTTVMQITFGAETISVSEVTAPPNAYYQAPNGGYTPIPNFVDPAIATGSPITLIPKNFII